MKLNKTMAGVAAVYIMAIVFSITVVLTSDTATKNTTDETIELAKNVGNMENSPIELAEGKATAGVAAVLAEYEQAATEAIELADIQRETIEFVTASDVEEILETVEEAQTQAEAEILIEEEPVIELTEEELMWQNALMADIKSEMNVRAEASKDAKVVGKLHKGDLATVIEQGEEWTLISSGNVEGYVKNEYCVYGQEAYEYALENCTTVATVQINGLRVRKDASTDSGVVSTLAANDQVIVDTDEETADGWVAVRYRGKTYYVSEEYVEVTLKTGEALTMEEEAALKKKIASEQRPSNGIEQTAAVAANVDEVTLLGAIIQCEGGNQSYDGQLAVGAVIANRIKSSRYPNSVYDVVFQKGQFGPVANGALEKRLNKGVGETALAAAQAALDGQDNTGGALHFKRASSGHAGVVIGAHVFY